MDDPPLADPRAVAGIANALAGGRRALSREAGVAAHLEERFPGIGRLVADAHAFRARAALWAVDRASPRAAGVIFASAGLPAPSGPPHCAAAMAAPSARFLYADPSPEVTDVNDAVLAAPDRGRVAAACAAVLDPAALLALPAARAILAAGPVSVQAVTSPHRWPPHAAARAVAAWARELPSGSSLCLCLLSPDPGPEGEELLDLLALAGGPAYAHAPGDVAAWIRDAGMDLHPAGVTDARAFAAPHAALPCRGLPARTIAAVALVR